MKVGVIDLGTNTFNLLIVELKQDNSFQTLHQNRIAVMLGKEGMKENLLSEAAIKRGIEALKQFRSDLNSHKAEHVVAKATSAIREAKNGAQFVAEAFTETNISIDIISGEEEARLIYEGVKKAVRLSDSAVLVIDIGGGSTEFIIANKAGIIWKRSFLLGAARLFEIIEPSDPISKTEIKRLNELLHLELEDLSAQLKVHPVNELVGVSGVFESFADIIEHHFKKKTLSSHDTEYTFNMEEFYEIGEIIERSTREQRLQMKGLINMRVDMIVISHILIKYVLRCYQIQNVKLSTYSMKEGILSTVHKKL